MEKLYNIVKTTMSEHESIMDDMQEFNESSNQFIGIFWFDSDEVELIDVYKIAEDKLPVKGNIKNYPKLHKDLWRKMKFKCRAKKIFDSIYETDYTLIKRGRIRKVGDEFQCLVGDWIYKYQDMLSMLIEGEFNIENIKFIEDKHWNIGNGWDERGL